MRYKAYIVLWLILISISTVSAYRYALVIGQNNGGNNVEKLHYAETDAKRCARLLETYAGFSRQNVTSLLKPDSNRIVAAIEQIKKKVSTATNPQYALFLLYYSGHADAEGLLLDSTYLPFSTLKKMVSEISAGIKIAIFDACQSGAVVAYKGGVRAAPFFLSGQQKMNGEVWIASSSANERSQESETLKSSLFSFHLFNGLRGSADVSSDNKVTVSEAYQYAYHKTIESSALTSGIVQHPVYRFNISGEGDIVLTDLSQKQGGIVIDGSCSGTFLILSRNYTDVYADFHKAAEKETFIGLPIGDYTIINARGGTSIGLYQFSIGKSQTIRCTSSMFHASLLQEARMKGTSSDEGIVDSSIGTSSFRAGVGFGVRILQQSETFGWDNDIELSLFGEYLLTPAVKGFLQGYGTTFGKYAGIDLGMGYTAALNVKTRGYIDGGVGLQFQIATDRRVYYDAPALMLQMGADIRCNETIIAGIAIPIRMYLSEDIQNSIGFTVRFMIKSNKKTESSGNN